jgi:hypothetical protein
MREAWISLSLDISAELSRHADTPADVSSNTFSFLIDLKSSYLSRFQSANPAGHICGAKRQSAATSPQKRGKSSDEKK